MKYINCCTLGEMCEAALDGEPVFILRAQDASSVATLRSYIQISSEKKASNLIRSKNQLERFISWQKENQKRVKVSD